MKHALVHGNRVCQVEDAPFPVAEPLQWVECADDVTTRHTFANGAFVAPSNVETNEEHNARVKARLAAIDLASIRGIREYIAAQPNAPQLLRDREAQVAQVREALK